MQALFLCIIIILATRLLSGIYAEKLLASEDHTKLPVNYLTCMLDQLFQLSRRRRLHQHNPSYLGVQAGPREFNALAIIFIGILIERRILCIPDISIFRKGYKRLIELKDSWSALGKSMVITANSNDRIRNCNCTTGLCIHIAQACQSGIRISCLSIYMTHFR